MLHILENLGRSGEFAELHYPAGRGNITAMLGWMWPAAKFSSASLSSSHDVVSFSGKQNICQCKRKNVIRQVLLLSLLCTCIPQFVGPQESTWEFWLLCCYIASSKTLFYYSQHQVFSNFCYTYGLFKMALSLWQISIALSYLCVWRKLLLQLLCLLLDGP